MCRYAMTSYKPHFVCFDCKKTFKRRLLIDIEGGDNKQKESVDAKCPQCGELMADMGLDFEAPKMNNKKEWDHIKDLFVAGVRFHSCGCTGPGYIPKDKNKLLQYLKEKNEYYIKQRRYWDTYNEPETQDDYQKQLSNDKEFIWSVPSKVKKGRTTKKGNIDIAGAVDYWSSCINNIEEKIRKVTTANNN